jgi:hypothetical protein
MGKAMVGVEGLHVAGPNAAGAAERSPMWLLIIVILSIVPGFDRITVLNTFVTSEECQIERNRIAFEMAAAYPNDRDFCECLSIESKPQLIKAAEGKTGSVNVIEAEDEDLSTCNLMTPTTRHNQLLKDRSNHTNLPADREFKLEVQQGGGCFSRATPVR